VNKISYERVKKGAATISSISLDARGKGYLQSYPIYTKFFQSSDINNKDDFIVRAGIVYSWMPRVLVLDKDRIDSAISAIHDFDDSKTEQDSSDLVRRVAEALNGSYIGASKFLHFQYPKLFPIYDTKVFKSINGIKDKKKQVYAQANKLNCYSIYMNSVNDIIGKKDFSKMVHKPINNYINDQFKYSVSKVRAVEFIVFSNYEAKHV
jgi:hypothetical protein